MIVPREMDGIALPEGWEWRRLADVTLRPTTRDPRKAPYEAFKYIDISAIDNQAAKIIAAHDVIGGDAPTRARQIVRAGDTLFSTVRVYLRNIAQVPIDLDGAIASTGFAVLRPSEGVDPSFLFHWTETPAFISAASALQRGVSYPAVNESQLLELGIPVPRLREQRRIVEAIETHVRRIDAGIAALRGAEVRCRVIRESAVRAAVERLNAWAPLVAVGEAVTALAGPAFQSRFFRREPGVKLLRGENIEPGRLRWIDVRYWPTEMLSGYEHLSIAQGDVILAMDRPVVAAGLKLARVTGADLPALLVQRVARLRPNPGVDGHYVYLMLSDGRFVQHLTDAQSGTQLPHVSLDAIRRYRIPLPPLETQRDTVTSAGRIEDVSTRLVDQIGRAAGKGRQLKRQVLAAAFTGRLVAGGPEAQAFRMRQVETVSGGLP